jgi:pyruvate dehydrogenase E2 component (dihydrolipoamide acetyltransferase)
VKFFFLAQANLIQPIAVLIEEGGDISAFEEFSIEDAGGEKAPPKTESKQEDSEASEPPSSSSATAPAKQETSAPEAQESDSTGGKLETSLDRFLKAPSATPGAKQLALERGVPLGQVKGTGPAGRITKEDVEKFKAPAGAAPAASAVPSYEDISASSMRKTIASRLQQSMNQSPHFYVSSSVSVSKLLKLRQALNASSPVKLSVNDFLVKASAVACKKVPQVNSSWREEGGQVVIRQYSSVDISVAVATPVGLMTPIVKGVETLGLESISSQIKELGKKARDGKLKPEQYQGGTFTISNMGMNHAVDNFTAVVNPPQAAILAVGTTRKVAIPVEGEDGTGVGWDDQITFTASFDHRVVDGAVGGEWIREFKKVLENPLELLL